MYIYYKSQYHVFQGPGETEPVVLPLPSGNPQRSSSHTFSLLHLPVQERYLNELSYFTIRDPYPYHHQRCLTCEATPLSGPGDLDVPVAPPVVRLLEFSYPGRPEFV